MKRRCWGWSDDYLFNINARYIGSHLVGTRSACSVFGRRRLILLLSDDLRKRILDAIDNCEGSRRKLAARFKVNTATITKLLRLRRETGSFEPRPHGGGIRPTLDHDALKRLRKLVEEAPDATLEALIDSQVSNVSASPPARAIPARVGHSEGAAD